MSNGRDENLYADRSYRPGPPPELREPPRRSRALGVFVATFAVAAFAGVVWYAYDQGLQRGSEATAPLIKADPSPTKVRPEQPGGLQVPNQDKLVYEAMRPGDGGTPAVERLLPPPEKPVEPPAPPPLPQDAQAGPSAEAPAPSADGDAAPASPSVAQAPTDSGIPPARIVTPAPTPRIPTPEETPPATAADASPEPAPPPAAAEPTPAPPSPAPADKPAPETAPEKPAAQEPAASPPPPATSRAAAPGGFRVQVGALRDQAAAEAEWARLQKRYPDQLGGLGRRIQRVDLGPGKGVFFRMQSGGVSEATAAAACTGLKSKGQPCIVVKP